jgi:hypothetical protein
MTEEGIMLPRIEHNFSSKTDPVAFADPPETRNVTPATTKEVSDILTNCRN